MHFYALLYALWMNKHPTCPWTKIALLVLVVFQNWRHFQMCLCFIFPFLHALAGFSQWKNRAHWWLSMEVSSSEPGSELSMTQSLFLWPDKIETIHSNSKETSRSSLLLSNTESIQTAKYSTEINSQTKRPVLFCL